MRLATESQFAHDFGDQVILKGVTVAGVHTAPDAVVAALVKNWNGFTPTGSRSDDDIVATVAAFLAAWDARLGVKREAGAEASQELKNVLSSYPALGPYHPPATEIRTVDGERVVVSSLFAYSHTGSNGNVFLHIARAYRVSDGTVVQSGGLSNTTQLSEGGPTHSALVASTSLGQAATNAPTMMVMLDYEDGPLVHVLPKADWDRRDPSSALKLVKAAPSFATLEALSQAYPSLHQQVEAPSLAAAVAHLFHAKVFVDESSLQDAIDDVLPTPAKVFSSASFIVWRAESAVRAPSLATLAPPRMSDGVLTYDEITSASDDLRFILARRVTLSFAGTRWTRTATDLPSGIVSNAETVAAVTKVFGGPVAGFQSTYEQGIWLYLAYGPSRGAQRYVVEATKGVRKRYATFAALAAAHRVVASPTFIAAFAQSLVSELGPEGLTVIADPADWWRQYERNEWRDVTTTGYFQGTHPKTTRRHTRIPGSVLPRPSVDSAEQLRVTVFDTHNQPRSVTVDLSTLSFDTTPDAQPLTASVIIEDESVGLRPGPARDLVHPTTAKPTP